MTDVRRVIRPDRRRFLFGSAGGVVSYALGLSPTISQPLHSTARIMVASWPLAMIEQVAGDVRYWLPAQSVDATQALNLSAGVSNPKVLRGRSLS